MKVEYKQQRYRAAEGRFDGNLNAMAAEGWRVESIDRVDDTFLVTYVREPQRPLKVDYCVQRNLEHVLEVNQKVGNELKSMVGSPQFEQGFVYTLVWEVTRPGPQPVFEVTRFDSR